MHLKFLPIIAISGGALVGCTPAERTETGTIIGDIGSAAPLICVGLNVVGAPPDTTKACGKDAPIVSTVATFVQGILDSMGTSAAAARASAAAFVGTKAFAMSGVTVILTPAAFDSVVAASTKHLAPKK